jgi:hypothetical protein
MPGRLKYIQQSQQGLSPVPVTTWLVKSLKHINHQVLIKFQQTRLKQGVEQFALRSMKLLIIFRIWRSCLSGRSPSLYLFTRVIKQTSNYRHITFVNYIQNIVQHHAVKAKSISTGNYWRSSMWILTQQINYWPYILLLSDT